jgi:hypothetical protein
VFAQSGVWCMELFQLIPGTFGGLALTDGALELIGDGEADDSESLLIFLVPLVKYFLELLLLYISKLDC